MKKDHSEVTCLWDVESDVLFVCMCGWVTSSDDHENVGFLLCMAFVNQCFAFMAVSVCMVHKCCMSVYMCSVGSRCMLGKRQEWCVYLCRKL